MSKNKNPDQASSSEKELLKSASNPEHDPSFPAGKEELPQTAASEDGNEPTSDVQSLTPTPTSTTSTENTAEKPASNKVSASETKTSDSANSNTAKANKKSSGLTAILVLFIVVILAAAGGAGYFGWQQFQLERQSVADLDNKINQQAQLLSQQYSNMSDALLAVENKMQEQSQDASSYDQRAQQLESYLERQLEGYREQLLTLSTTSTDDWKLAEAYYLTRLAVQRLQMEKSTIGALALLQAADDIVKAQKDPELYRVREALANDITALQLAGAIDREGIYLQLAAIIKQLDGLPNSIPENFQDIKESEHPLMETSRDVEDGAIKNSFKKLLSHFQSYFRVRHIEDNVDISVAIQQSEIAKVRLTMLLESAQLALLREQQEIYNSSLTKAKELVLIYFSAGSSNSDEAQAEKLSALIEKLQAEPVEQPIPDIQQSQIVLGDYLEKLHKIKPTEVKPTDSSVESSSLDQPVQTVTQ